jgi:hypothetical protein
MAIEASNDEQILLFENHIIEATKEVAEQKYPPSPTGLLHPKAPSWN